MDDEDDTPRHTRLHGIDGSTRRLRGAATKHVKRGPIVDQPDIHGSEGATDFDDREPDSDSFQDYLDVAARAVRQSAVAHDREVEESDEQPTQRVGGRFASTGTSKRPKASEDESWVVTAPVDGGPVDGSVIPSFLGHVDSVVSDMLQQIISMPRFVSVVFWCVTRVKGDDRENWFVSPSTCHVQEPRHSAVDCVRGAVAARYELLPYVVRGDDYPAA
ncbi:uncharacterized protein [Euphorbia lathyris]|uniref:uncharacterized protein n=1 Tax=Euphorbia lathyris TaxID=212925 RepID=UPI003313B467